VRLNLLVTNAVGLLVHAASQLVKDRGNQASFTVVYLYCTQPVMYLLFISLFVFDVLLHLISNVNCWNWFVCVISVLTTLAIHHPFSLPLQT